MRKYAKYYERSFSYDGGDITKSCLISIRLFRSSEVSEDGCFVVERLLCSRVDCIFLFVENIVIDICLASRCEGKINVDFFVTY